MKGEASLGKALITGHRGMGVLEKPRDLLLEGERFYPENSIAAFKEAIREGADALECDIHVTSDGHAMVIHGSKAYQYADYIGEDAGLHLASGDTLEVEKFTKEELQASFCLKSRISEFDSLDKHAKADIISDETNKNAVVKEKTELLADDPDSHRIPTLNDLLTLAYEENRIRAGQGKPPLKVNIELKGHGSGIASLGAIQRFYHENPETERFLPPDQLVFLGRREVGEIAIANGILKGKRDLGERELYDQFAEDFIAKEENIDAQREPFERSLQTKHTINTTVERCGALPPALTGMEHQVIIKSYLEVGGDPRKLDEMLHSGDFLGQLEEQGLTAPFREAYSRVATEAKPALKKYFDKKELGKHFEGEMAGEISRLTTAIGNERSYSVDFREFVDKGIELEWRKLPTNRTIKEQLAQQATLSGIKAKPEIYAAHLGELRGAKTNLMVTTGQLFGKEAIANEEDFDTLPSVTEISEEGRNRVYEAYTKYGYNGIDISLYDFTPELIKTIQRGIHESGHIRPEEAVLGVTASNWKGSERENSPTDPCYAVTRAEAIARQCNTPLLLKVDEPGLFKTMLERSRAIERGGLEFGTETTLVSTEMELTPAPVLSRNYKLQPELLTTTPIQAKQPIHKISSKPPRGMEKKPDFVTREVEAEVEEIRRSLLEHGITISSTLEDSSLETDKAPNAPPKPKGHDKESEITK